MLVASHLLGIAAVSPEDKVFYQQLGLRIAQLRKAQHLTQQQVAEQLGISQQTLAHYEVGRLRIAVAMLPPLARLLGVSLEELFGENTAARGKRGPVSRLQQQLEQVAMLSRSQQQFVIKMLDTVLQQAS